MEKKNITNVITENEVTIQGVIVHKFVTDKVAILTINTGNATTVQNNPKVLFFNELRNKVADNFNVKDYVLVKGNVQTSKKKENIKNQILQAIFAEDITPAQGLIEEAFDVKSDKCYRQYKNLFKIAGQVQQIEMVTPSIVRITVKTDKNGHISFPKILNYTKTPKDVFDKIHPKDNIYVIGNVQTTKVEKNGKISHYENFVALEIGSAE